MQTEKIAKQLKSVIQDAKNTPQVNPAERARWLVIQCQLKGLALLISRGLEIVQKITGEV